MAEIQVRHERGDIYRVEVSEGSETSSHRVTVPPDELQRYGGGAEAEELLVASFRFLLEREPSSAILSRFELSTIERYFPEYPEVIRERVG